MEILPSIPNGIKLNFHRRVVRVYQVVLFFKQTSLSRPKLKEYFTYFVSSLHYSHRLLPVSDRVYTKKTVSRNDVHHTHL